MGVLYNVPPIRTKEWPYVDVLSESINNPIRLFLGWFALIGDRVPPLSLALSYWMIGAFFMAMKRYAEYRHIGDPAVAAAYRHSFKHYTEERLLVSILFYATTCALFAGIFIVRYHLELLLFVPQAAGLFAYYLHLGMKPDSPTQNPEKLYRERGFVAYLVVCFAVFVLLMFTRVPVLYQWFNVEPAGTSPLWTVGKMISFVIPVRNGAADLPRCLSSIAANLHAGRRVSRSSWWTTARRTIPAEIARRVGRARHRPARPEGWRLQKRGRGRLARRRPGVRRRRQRDRTRLAARVRHAHFSNRGWARPDTPTTRQPTRRGSSGCTTRCASRAADRRDVEWLGAGNLAVRRTVFEHVGGFDERLEACEDVQLCHSVRRAGYRVVSEPGMDSVHHGDPRTLSDLFFGELWRGRDNLRVSLRGPWTLRTVPSALLPVAGLGCVALAGGRAGGVALGGRHRCRPRAAGTGWRSRRRRPW